MARYNSCRYGLMLYLPASSQMAPNKEREFEWVKWISGESREIDAVRLVIVSELDAYADM